MSVTFEVLRSEWADEDDVVYAGGVHVVEDPSDAFLNLLAGAAAAGVLEIQESTKSAAKILDAHVQSQEDGEAAYEAAQADGRWHHGNLLQFVIDKQDRLAHDDTVDVDDPDKLSVDDRARLEAQLAEAQSSLEAIEVPT